MTPRQFAPSVTGISDLPPSVTNRRPVVQARALETRARILDQAERAFARRGFDATSLTSDILRPAGVSVGSFYHQFDNKESVLLALCEERINVRHAHVLEVLAATDAGFRDSLAMALHGLARDVDEAPDAWRVRYRERYHPDRAIRDAIDAGWRRWSRVARDLVERCYTAPPDRIDAAAELTVIVVSGALYDYLDGDRGRRRRAGLDLVADFCVAGVERVIRG